MSEKHCTYPDCNCPFDHPGTEGWCARGLPTTPASHDAVYGPGSAPSLDAAHMLMTGLMPEKVSLASHDAGDFIDKAAADIPADVMLTARAEQAEEELRCADKVIATLTAELAEARANHDAYVVAMSRQYSDATQSIVDLRADLNLWFGRHNEACNDLYKMTAERDSLRDECERLREAAHAWVSEYENYRDAEVGQRKLARLTAALTELKEAAAGDCGYKSELQRLRAAGKEAGHIILAYINGERHTPAVSHAIALAHGLIDGTADVEKLTEYYFDRVEAEEKNKAALTASGREDKNDA